MLEQKEIDPGIINRAIAATVRVDCKSPDYPRDLPGFKFLSFSLERIGTGVHLGRGRVITARHVLDGLEKPEIYVSGNQRRWAGEIAGLSEDLDIGIIQIDPSADLGLVEVKPTIYHPEDDDALFILGASSSPIECLRASYIGDGMDLYPNDSFCKETVILRITPNHILRDGFSGAGVFDCRGRLVGMVFGKSRLDPTVITVKGSAIQTILECNL